MPRLSNGCRACLNRKRRCDERKPMCLNCERLGKTCPGYNQERRWVDQTNKTANQYGMTLYARSATPPSTIREINPARMHDEALVALIDTLYAPRDGINRTEWAFLGRLSNIPNWAPPLRAALQAAATAQAATVSQTQELDVEAKTYNGHAIRALSQSLVRTNYAPVHTAAAAMILAFTQYLGVITGGTSAWRTHIMGALAVSRTPKEHARTDPLASEMLRTLRLHLVWKDVFDGQRDSAALKDELEQNDPGTESSPTVAFIHSMEAIQALLKELAKLEHSITSWSDVNDAVSMYLNLQEQIEGPWSPARKEFPLGRTDALLGSAGLAMDNNAFPNAYIFQDMVEARAFGRYLQAKVYLASAARRLKALIHVRFSWRADGEIARLGEASEMEHMDDLCSCVPVMCTPDNGLGGKASALIFLMLGTPFYKHHGISEKHRWCEELSASLEKLGVTL